MAKIGAITLVKEGVANPAGAAFSLSVPATEDATLSFEDAEVEVRKGQRDVVIRFGSATDANAAYLQGHTLVQQGLDLLSILGILDAVIHDAEDEHTLWWTEPDGLVMRLVSTTLLKLTVGQVKVVVHDKDGNVIPPATVQPRHHTAFRYYRLAQNTDDLFDAYRNMYLAFELLLSSSCPPAKGEREIDWLRRALHAAGSTMRLDGVGLESGSTPVESLLDAVYRDARLPLFHAKEGKEFFAPHVSASDRAAVAKALGVLTTIVLRMAEKWHDARRRGGGVFLG